MLTTLPLITEQKPPVAPTFEQLSDAGKDGIMVRNPDNGLVFRTVLYSWEGCVYGLKFFKAEAKKGSRPMKGILMAKSEIEHYLSGVVIAE